MTLNQFLVIGTAYREREEDKWDRTAHLICAIVNHSGMGATEPIHPDEIFPLRKYQEDKISPITSWEEALELIDSM